MSKVRKEPFPRHKEDREMDFLIHHMLRSSAARFPRKEALVHGSQRLSYSEVERRVCALASGLNKAGVRRGDRVGILLEPSVSQALSIFGISQANAVFVPMNHLLFPDQVAHIINDCRMKALITTRAKLSSLLPMLQQTCVLKRTWRRLSTPRALRGSPRASC